MATKDDVIRLHREHPKWCANAIANELGCMSEYVRATAKRQNLILPKAVEPSKRRVAMSNARVDLEFLRKAIEAGDPFDELLARCRILAQDLEAAA